MKTPFFTIMLLLFPFFLLTAQDAEKSKRTTEAFRTASSIRIDGNLDEADWQKAKIATDFIQNDPKPKDPATQKTEVRILYDNRAIYVGAKLYDTDPTAILQELSERDNLGNTDWFVFVVDAYQGGNDGVGFLTTPAGVQFDTKYSTDGEDSNWDAVWNSKSVITDEGWIVEMEIPYSALRFPNTDVQNWNVNFGRMIRRNREKVFWSFVDPNQDGFLQQAGTLDGISNIKPPLRLSATPFIAGYLQNYSDKAADPQHSWGRSFNGGMDIKYGINDAFTLDMTLIPDFGEAQSDNQVLNLSPFEVRFDENRQFFTEGTELFDRGGLFYSRRVGGRPLHYWDVEDGVGLEADEEIIENPQATQLINATKVSGRTKSGLGVGVFNAVAAQTLATVRNSEGAERKVETSPLTNYNVTVFDQNLKNNSYFSLINTNVMRNGADYDANVTGVDFELKNKDNTYGIFGDGAVNQKYFSDADNEFGHKYSIGFGKISGTWNWSLYHDLESYDYDPNDLGFLFSPNEREIGGEFSYTKYDGFLKHFTAGGFGGYMGYSRLHKPDVYTDFGANLRMWVRTKDFTHFNMWTYIEPFKTYDYFEPRRADFSRFLLDPRGANVGGWISSDYRKKFAFDINGNYRFNESGFNGRRIYSFGIAPRFRVNNKLSFRWQIGSQRAINDVGYVDDYNDDIIMGLRNEISVTNTFNASYIFNNAMSLTLRSRHYWAKAEYKSFHKLALDGTLADTDYNEFNDNSFNAFTVDAVYRWRFAPGSDIFVIWKNGIFGSDSELDDIIYAYNDSISRLRDTPKTNSLSVKIIYFLDYLSLTKRQG